MSNGISITNLTKSVEKLAEKLNNKGYKATVYTFTDGSKGGCYGGSRVELTVDVPNGDDTTTLEFECYAIYGYTSNLDNLYRQNFEYSGQSTKWGEMKKHILAVIEYHVNNPSEF